MKNKSSTAQRTSLLGGLDVRQFLNEYWQKKPLLIRGAIPSFTGLLGAEELAGLACEDEVQARLILQADDARWQLESGPFAETRFVDLPSENWTLLVQNVNHYLPQAAELLQRFDFIPHARLDDVMVSYAPDGGGVGPHFDSYDVFLLQGQGKRLWRVSEQQDLALLDDVPLRILKNFVTEQEWLLEPGDMLYLPPQIAHWGIAVGDAMTYSIGFRAPSAQELGTHFLAYLQERIQLSGMYADASLKPQRHAAKLSASMVKQVGGMLNKISWDETDVADFLGTYLTEPKPHVVFDAPRVIGLPVFQRRLEKNGIRLSLQSQMLFHGRHFYINGEQVEIAESGQAVLKQLADQRRLAPGRFMPAVVELLHCWYLAGYCQFRID